MVIPDSEPLEPMSPDVGTKKQSAVTVAQWAHPQARIPPSQAFLHNPSPSTGIMMLGDSNSAPTLPWRKALSSLKIGNTLLLSSGTPPPPPSPPVTTPHLGMYTTIATPPTIIPCISI